MNGKPTADAPIGIVDSDVGGLTVARAPLDPIARHGGAITVTAACPWFVDVVERGTASGRRFPGRARGRLEPLLARGVDTRPLRRPAPRRRRAPGRRPRPRPRGGGGGGGWGGAGAPGSRGGGAPGGGVSSGPRRPRGPRRPPPRGAPGPPRRGPRFSPPGGGRGPRGPA